MENIRFIAIVLIGIAVLSVIGIRCGMFIQKLSDYDKKLDHIAADVEKIKADISAIKNLLVTNTESQKHFIEK